MGHVFRDKSPYSFPGGVAKIVNKNAARVAEVWMDEWRDFYYSMNPGKYYVCSRTNSYSEAKAILLSGILTICSKCVLDWLPCLFLE